MGELNVSLSKNSIALTQVEINALRQDFKVAMKQAREHIERLNNK